MAFSRMAKPIGKFVKPTIKPVMEVFDPKKSKYALGVPVADKR